MEEKWYKVIDKTQRNALIGGFGSWSIDAMDMMLYIMALGAIMKEFAIDTAVAGMLASATLFSSAVGGMIFGVIADYIGRKKTLVIAIVLYTLFTGLSGIATSVKELILYRALLGLGMGGAWATAALLVTETWPKEHRGKASSFMQGGFAVGYMIAAILAGLILPLYGWRILFFVGVIPSLIMLVFVISCCQETPLWLEGKTKEAKICNEDKGFNFIKIFQGDLLKYTIVSSLFVSLIQLGYWGLFTWLPAFLSTPASQGGAGMNIVKTSGWVLAMQVGALIGYVLFGYLSYYAGRKKAFAMFLLIAAVVVPIYGNMRDETWLLIMGPLIGRFGTGFYGGFGAFLSELFPTSVRGTALGFVYNFGRGVSALAPAIIGTLAKTYGIGSSLLLTALFYSLGVLAVIGLPETKGKSLK